MSDDALTDDELRRIVATSRDERARRAARRVLNARSDAGPMPNRIGPPMDVDWGEVDRRARVHVHAVVLALGRSLTLAEAGAIVRDIVRDLSRKGR